MALHWTLDSPKSPEEVRDALAHYLKNDHSFFEGAMTKDGFKLKTSFESPIVCLLGQIESAEHGSLVEVTFTKTEVDVVVMTVIYPFFIVGLFWASWLAIQQGGVFLIPMIFVLGLIIHLLCYSWPASRRRQRAIRQLISLLAPQSDNQFS